MEHNSDSQTLAMDIGSLFVNAAQGGLGNLAAYSAAQVPLCLLPAFYIAGAMTALIGSAERRLKRAARGHMRTRANLSAVPSAAHPGGIMGQRCFDLTRDSCGLRLASRKPEWL